MKIIIICILSSLATNLGFLFTFISNKYQKYILTLSLSLSFSLMLLISVTDLIPNALVLVGDLDKKMVFIYSITILLLCNLFIKYINNKIEEESSLKKIGILNSIALFLHNIPEGIICAITSINNIELGIKTCITIMIHNIPEGMSISIPIYNATKSRWTSIIPTLLSSSGELFGVLLSFTILKNINRVYMYILLMLAAGIMISISINNILPEIKNKNRLIITIGIITSVGIVLSLL